MIVKFLKLKLFGMLEEKEQILTTLFRTKCIELKSTGNIDNTHNNFNEQDFLNLKSKRDDIFLAIEFIEDILHKNKVKYLSSPFLVKMKDFENYNLSECLGVANSVISLKGKLHELEIEEKNITSKLSKISPLAVGENTEDIYITGTKDVTILRGKIKLRFLKSFQQMMLNFPLATYELRGNVATIFVHNSILGSLLESLKKYDFEPIETDYKESVYDALKDLDEKHKAVLEERKLVLNEILTYDTSLKTLKMGYDYITFKMEKLNADNLIKSTSSTFYLEAFLPDADKNIVEKALNNGKFTVDFEFTRPTKVENPPILLKNNRLVEPFEFVTNMYSPPSYHELDPNGFIMFFFSLFFGFVMADIGYGLVLILLGLILSKLKGKSKGFRQLMEVIAIGGVFTIVFGLLFGSFFGLSHADLYLVPVALFPNPINEVITLLIACLIAGMVQIMISLLLKGILLIRKKLFLEAFFSAFIWELFFVGLCFVGSDMLHLTNNLELPGFIIAGSVPLISMLGMVYMSKGFERFTNGFNSIYGAINIFSDILSYTRLFGLMLSAFVIAGVINNLVSGFFGGFFTAILGVIILILGHAFNIAMGVLGAYVHIVRLQYIEFFSHFYEGEGELFKPFASDFSYINLE